MQQTFLNVCGIGDSQMKNPLKLRVIPASSMAYRPRDYFGRYDIQTELMTSVRGTLRRKALRSALEIGELDQINDEAKKPTLNNISREMLGSIHPSFMGGEYLPKIKVSEVEIARISIKSTTGDVTCLYARPVGCRISYRMADEYEGNTLNKPTTRTSIKPMTMGEMVVFFMKSWNLFECLDFNYEDDTKGKLDFFTAESEYYPYFESTLRELVLNRANERGSSC